MAGDIDSVGPLAIEPDIPMDFDGSTDSMPLPPPKQSVPWPLIGGIGGAILLVALIAAGLIMWLPNALNPPDKIVRRYYDALQAQDSDKVHQCLDPQRSPMPDLVSTVVGLKPLLEEGAKMFGLDLKLAWSLSNLQFKTIEQKGDTAKVQVTGQVYVGIANSTLGFSRPYDVTHNVVKRNGQWYVSP